MTSLAAAPLHSWRSFSRMAIHAVARCKVPIGEAVMSNGDRSFDGDVARPSVATALEVTDLIERLNGGEDEAFSQLWTVLYDELRMLARSRLRGENPGHTLQTTALVNEAFIRLIANDDLRVKGRAHFFGAASEAMRRILFDRARHHACHKRRGDRTRVPLDQVDAYARDHSQELIDMEESFEQLTARHPRQGRVLSLRFFLDMTVAEVAELLDISENSVINDWRFGKAWLARGSKSHD